jgi:mono/diheme cytochrome c family protein
MKYMYHITIIFSVLLLASSCQQPGANSTGSEYMPDMAHSIAYEANTYSYYGLNRWGSEDEYHKFVQPRNPVNGSIARGYAGNVLSSSHQGISVPSNGAVPYYYGDTEEERIRAIKEIIKNPYPITASGLDKGKLLYNIYCATCHGEKGDGAGYLVRDDGGKYPVQPANFISDEFISSSNGRYYHGIYYGKNLMSGYTDKLSYEERWQVIHYIRLLQAASKKLEYSEASNTLNTVDVPASKLSGNTETKSSEIQVDAPSESK